MGIRLGGVTPTSQKRDVGHPAPGLVALISLWVDDWLCQAGCRLRVLRLLVLLQRRVGGCAGPSLC